MNGMEEFRDEILEERQTRKSSLTESEKTLIRKEISELSDSRDEEGKKSYLDIQMNGHSDTENDVKVDNMPAKEQELLSEIIANDSKRTLPSVEISQYFDEDANGMNVKENSENVLAIIEEEKSISTSISEMTEAGDKSETLLNEDTALLNLNESSTADDNCQPINENDIEVFSTEILPFKENSNQAIIKENEVLKARITEVNEQLENSKKVILDLKQSLCELEEEVKDPASLSAKLAAKTIENESLKKEIAQQKNILQKATEKEESLSEQVNFLTMSEAAKLGELSEKQFEIERLQENISKLSNAMQTVSQNDHDNKNGQLSLNAHDNDANNKAKNHQSKICNIL